MQPAEVTDRVRRDELATRAAGADRPLHVGVIMDGNGRWAERRGLPRRFGHRAGAAAVRRTVENAPRLGIETLTLYAFSCDNWRRPAPEVEALMSLFEDYLGRERKRALREGLRVSVIGRRDRLRPSLLDAIAVTESTTAGGRTLHLRLAVDYSGREAILAAASRQPWGTPLDRHAFERSLHEAVHSPRRGPGARPGDPHRRREAAVGFSALGERLRRALLHRPAVARLLGRRSRAGGGGLRAPAAALRGRRRRAVLGARAIRRTGNGTHHSRGRTAAISSSTRWRKLNDTYVQ